MPDCIAQILQGCVPQKCAPRIAATFLGLFGSLYRQARRPVRLLVAKAGSDKIRLLLLQMKGKFIIELLLYSR